MAVFYTETGSIGKLQVSGSGASIFSVSGSTGPLFDISDTVGVTSDLFKIRSASIDVFNIDASQNIEISASLSISYDTGSIIELWGYLRSSSLYISSSGRIGIGTINPQGRLDVSYAGNTNDPTIRLGSDDVPLATSRTNLTTKFARVGVAHHQNAFSASAIIIGSSTGTGNQIFIGGGSAYMNSANDIRFYTATTTASLTGTETMRISGSGEIFLYANSTISGSTSTIHLIGTSAAPSIAVGTGAGSGPTGTISGSDLGGILRLRTGTTPTANAPIATVTFRLPYTTIPAIILYPYNTASVLLTGSGGIFITSSTTSFTAFSGNTALPASTAFSWSYFVIQ
jgi:hypothetical protein